MWVSASQRHLKPTNCHLDMLTRCSLNIRQYVKTPYATRRKDWFKIACFLFISQVNLISPVIPKDKHQSEDAPISQNKKGNIVWRSSIKAGETETFTLHYTVEKPVDSRELEFKDQ